MSSVSGSTGNPPGGAAKRRSMLPPPKSYTKNKTADQTITKSGSEEIRQPVKSPCGSKCNTTVSLSRVPEAGCLKVGDRVKISGVRTGVVRFCGPTHFAEGQWYGIELDDPEGRHDGLVEGTRYFQCKPNHGLFAPIHKVEVFTEDLYMYDSEAVYATSDISSCDERSPSPEDGRGEADKTVRVKHQVCRTLSHSSHQQQEKGHAKPRSRLLQKKVWDSKELESTDTTSSSRESSTSHESDTGRVKKAEKRSATDGTSVCKADETFTVLCSPHEKKTKMSDGKQELNMTYVADAADENNEQILDVCNSSRVDDHTAHVLAYGVDLVNSDAENRNNINDTYSVQDYNESLVIDSQPTVTHEREVSELESSGCASRVSSTGQTPDVLTNCTFVKQPSLEWDPEEDGDKLGMSSYSKSCSVDVLSDTQLLFENNFVQDLSHNISPQVNSEDVGLMAKQKHAVPEVIEAELDKEIAGMATPEIDVSSSTVSGKEDSSSPEPDQAAILKKDLDLPIALPDVHKSKQISPPQVAQKSAGEKLATPSTEVITVKDYGDKFQEESGARGPPHRSEDHNESDKEIKELDLKEHRLSASFELAKTAVEQYASLVKGAEEEKTIQHEKIKSLKTQDLMSVSLNSRFQFLAGLDVKGLNDETFPDNLMTSMTLEPGLTLDEASPDSSQLEFDNKILNLTGDGIFAGDSSQVGLANDTVTSVNSDQAPSDSLQSGCSNQDGSDVGVMVTEDEQVAEDVSKESYPDNSDDADVHHCQDLFDRGSRPITGGDEGVTVGHRSDAEQLMADLEAGHTRVERPVSLVSSCSADTGIVVDYRDGTRERPFSIASTSSADTGYQPEQDTESGSGTTSCTLTETNGSSPSDVIMQSDITMDTVVIPEFKDPPASVTLEANKTEKHDQKEDRVESDEDQPASPEGVTVTAEPEEMSGTESQQGEELGEITVQEELTPEAAMEDEHMMFQQDEVTISQSIEEPELQATYTLGEGHSPMTLTTGETMDTEMVESATMKDVMEKCVAVESEKLVKDIQVEAHIEKREVYKEPVKSVTEHKNGVSLGRLEEDVPEPIITDGDSLGDITPLEIDDDQGERGHNDDEEMADATDITDTADAADSSQLPVEKKVVKQTKEKVKSSTPLQLQKHQSQLKKRKDENIAASKLQTKSSRQQSSLRSNIKTSSQNIPVPSKVNNKVESDRKMSANKLQKNVSNKKKAEKSLTKIMLVTSDKKGKSFSKNFDKEKSLAKARKELDMLPSVPSESIAPHLKTVEVHPVLEKPEGDKKADGVSSKAPRRSLPQRKFSGVKSQIDSGLRSTAKSDSKSRKSDASHVPAVAKMSAKPRLSLPQPSAGLVKRSAPHASSVTSSTGSKVGSTSGTRAGSSDARMPKQSRWSLHTGRQHLETKMSGSQQSLSSDHSGKASQSASAADRSSAKRKSSSYRDRSSSTGSECRGQLSSSSAVSTARTKPPPGKQSLITPPGKRTITEPRRLSAAVTSSQGATPKVTKRSQSLVTSTPAGKRTIGLAKSKTQKGGTSSSLSSSMKQQQQQPDVVTNAITRSNVTKEITRLGALCEARTKELNRIKIDLRRQNTGFEAVAIVVKYFTEELAEAKEQLKKAVLQLEELTRQRDALIDEIQSIKQQHVEETESLMSKHQESLSALSKKLTTEKEEEVKQVIEKHSHEVTTLKSFHERNIKELEEKHDKLMAEKNKQYEEELTRRRLDHEKQINDLHLEHESKLNEITMRFETIKLNLLEKVEFLRMEGEELRRREAAMTEKCQRESDYKIQHALAQYKQDVDSLTAVLDLRNGEIHELQRQNLELQKELEKLPVAQDKIKSLEQQIENLQAIIDIRANNERSLSEKHHVLLRKYDKETKVMKRLSMDNEELMYRLQMEAGYQDVMRRSISHSPTSSETSTPEPTRRHKSPLPQSPRSPCEPKRSPVQKTAPRGSMKRTGTYEVLPQEYDDMNNIKQSDI